MTLIEVLAALLLMGSMLVALISARGRLWVQHAHAADKQDAVRAADELLTSWWSSDPPRVPRSGHGEVDANAGWAWSVSEVAGAEPEGLAVRVVRLTILDERDPAHPRVLTQVEVLVPEAVPAVRTRSEGER